VNLARKLRGPEFVIYPLLLQASAVEPTINDNA
jgi:hypothetical protein